ncbi:unannotated protein [freshwater metagenome]|uniref:Unannotated protein n=1 Tax=freshwater metagenome TaxID=449393 RepID=A0A6J6W2N1_9ZZZZ
MSQVMAAITTPRNTIIEVRSTRLMPNSSGRAIFQPLCPWRSQFHLNKSTSPRNPSASVANASGNPPSRNAGSETTMPSAMAARLPRMSAGNHGQPCSTMTLPAVNAATMTNAACDSDTMPPRPVTITNDKNTTAKDSPVARLPSQASLFRKKTNVHTKNSTTAMTHGRFFRHVGRSSVHSTGGGCADTLPPRRPRSRARNNRPASNSTKGTELLNPLMSFANVA